MIHLKALLASLFLTPAITAAHAQIQPPATASTEPTEVAAATPVKSTPADICKNPDKPAEYPGGLGALANYLRKNLKHPDKKNKNRATGKVLAQFIINSSGKMQDLKIGRGVSPECDAEVLRVLRNMPDWQAAVNQGKKVSMYFTLPVSFN